jgi:uncharacterized ferritin-like protein (DUF455 family)
LFNEICNNSTKNFADVSVSEECEAGTPEKPELVPAFKLPKRRIASKLGHAALIHSFAHIEFNAINIAWDAVYRFSGMPDQFYRDWARIAKEEAYHFELINGYLNEMDFEYGSFQAHDDLWDMVKKTSHDVMVRMALVPRVLEARGLDVTPDIIKRFTHHGYDRAVEILEIIYRDEIGHVHIGSHWFKYLCSQRNIDPTDTFIALIREFATDKIRKPFNNMAREQAGFTKFELELLNTWEN